MPYYLFRTGTTGLQKIKKSKPFPTFEEALSAGQALNILEATLDRVFVIIPEESLQCYTNITDPLPFSESFFRFPRLSDSKEKFKSGGEKFLSTSPIQTGLAINPAHPSISNLPKAKVDSWAGKSIYQILSSEGFNRSLATEVQSHYQFELGLSPFPAQSSPDSLRIISILDKLFLGDKKKINDYLSSHLMTLFKSFGQVAEDQRIFNPQEITKEDQNDHDII